MFGYLLDRMLISNGDIVTFKLAKWRKLIKGSLLLVGLITLHEWQGALNENGRLVLGPSSGVGGDTGEKHKMVQRYGYRGNFCGVGQPKIHHKKQRYLRKSEQG